MNVDYIEFYNKKILQKNLKSLTPIKYRNQTLAI
ncbi:IS3 family transposase [Clostridium uliginosum]